MLFRSGSGDQFGVAVSLSADGNRLAVGANLEDGQTETPVSDSTLIPPDDGSANDSGAVYVFIRSGNSWSQQAYVKPQFADTSDQFGTAISLSADGNRLAVGALFEDSDTPGIGVVANPGNNGVADSGAAYVFDYFTTTSSWSQGLIFKAGNVDVDDHFGAAISLSADGLTLAVGARDEDSNSTSVDENDSDNTASNSGAVYIFSKNTTAGMITINDGWGSAQKAYIKASNTGSDDQFGVSVSLSTDGNTLAVGANSEDGQFNGIVSNSATIPADDGTSNTSGAVYVFNRSGSGWSQQAYVKASNSGASDRFGFSVSLSGDGNTLAVAALFEGSSAIGIGGDDGNNDLLNAGAVYMYSRSSTDWNQQAYIKASNTGPEDQFGRSVSLSSGGNTLVVGARNEASDATGINGDNSDDSTTGAGAVYVY